MGFSPQQVDQMSLWEFNACAFHAARANGVKQETGTGDMSEDRLRELGIDGFNGT